MEQSSLLGQFVSYEENGVLWIQYQVFSWTPTGTKWLLWSQQTDGRKKEKGGAQNRQKTIENTRQERGEGEWRIAKDGRGCFPDWSASKCEKTKRNDNKGCTRHGKSFKVSLHATFAESVSAMRFLFSKELVAAIWREIIAWCVFTKKLWKFLTLVR